MKCLNRVYGVQNSVPCILNMIHSYNIWSGYLNTIPTNTWNKYQNLIYMNILATVIYLFTGFYLIFVIILMFQMLFIHSSIIVYYQINLFTIALTCYVDVVISTVKSYCASYLKHYLLYHIAFFIIYWFDDYSTESIWLLCTTLYYIIIMFIFMYTS